MNDERIRDFLVDSLKLWGIVGTVEPGEAPIVAVIRASDGATIHLERYPVRAEPVEGRTPPFRWVVRAPRPRPCTSIAGVLNALRSALGVERGEPIRVTPAPVRPEPVEGRTTR